MENFSQFENVRQERSCTRITPCRKVGFRYHENTFNSAIVCLENIKSFKERGDLSDCLRCGRPRSQRSKSMIKCIRERIWRNPRRSIRLLAKTANMSPRTLRRLVHKDLKIFSFSLQKRQTLSSFTLQETNISLPKACGKFTAMLRI